MNFQDKIKYGEALLNKGELNEAVKTFIDILQEDEFNYLALNYVGIIYSLLKKYDLAGKYLEKAIKIKPSKPNAYLNLAIILFQNGKSKDALKYYQAAIERDKTNSTAYYNYAVSLNELCEYEKAKENYEKAVKYEPHNFSAYYNLGLLNLLLGNYEKGWEGYEYRVKANVVEKRIMPGKKWNGKPVKNSTLYVYPDQGFGDTIQFVRFLPEIKRRVGKLIFECQPSLFPLLKNVHGFDKIVPMNKLLKPVVQYDYYLPITSLGGILKLNENSSFRCSPYIEPEKNKDDKWEKYFCNSEKKKIGLVWRSNSRYKDEKNRSVPLAALSSILTIPGNKFFSLQMEPTPDERELLNKYNINDLSTVIKNFNDTANIIEQLDIIISVDTAVPHLAGAMGKQTWLLLSSQPDWRWQLNDAHSRWYPSLKLFRQKECGNWDNVVENIYYSLNVLSNKNLKENTKIEIFTNKGMERLKKFLLRIKEDTYPETPMDIHTKISNNMISEVINKVELPHNARILDIGCGQGVGLKKFSEFGFNLVGITLNTTDYEICKNQGYEVYQMDQSFLQFEDEAFDLLWARHVLEHSIFPYYTLHEYNRVLKKNGLIYIEVPAAEFDAVHENNPNHYSVLTKTMWRSLFNKAGFDLLYELDFDLVLEESGKDQYWMFILNKQKKGKDAE